MFSFLQSKPPQVSKFKKHSESINKLLVEWHQERKGPLYDHQVSILLKTHGLMLNDDAHLYLRPMITSPTKPMVIVSPTGSGKTGIIAFLPYILKSNNVLILTPSHVITKQIFCAFGGVPRQKCFFEEIGVIPKNPEVDDPKTLLDDLLEEPLVIGKPDDILNHRRKLVIVNAQKFGGKSKMSLMHKNERIIEDVEEFFARFDTLIVDEAHRYPAPTWYQIIQQFNKPLAGVRKRIVFLTATPYKVINGKEEFILGDAEEASRKIEADAEEGTRRSCVFKEKTDTSCLLADINKILSQNLKRESGFQPQAMILVYFKREAIEWTEKLNKQARDPNFAVVLKAGQPEILADFKAGKYQVAITCGVAIEGFNNPSVVCCVILRKVSSQLLFEQFIGRCMRLKLNLGHKDRSEAVVLSYKKYEQKKLWHARDTLAEDDYVETDDEIPDERPRRSRSNSSGGRNANEQVSTPQKLTRTSRRK